MYGSSIKQRNNKASHFYFYLHPHNLHDFSPDVFVVQKIEKHSVNTNIPAQSHQFTQVFKTAFKNNTVKDNNTVNVPELLQLSVYFKRIIISIFAFQ
jgi:hypothetical protein